MPRSVRRQRQARRRTRIRTAAYWIAGAVALAGILVVRGLPHRSATNTGFPFPCLAREALALHVHPYLRIMIEGQPVQIPAAIGIRDPQFDQGIALAGSCFEPLHTHDSSGIIHIEAPDPNREYTLGDFFAVWRATYSTIKIGDKTFPVNYGADEILGHKADAAHTVRLLVDGKPSPPRPSLVLNNLDYCSARNTSPPCFPTAVGDPYPPAILNQYGRGHTIVLSYQ
jgi:hypothetical protein